MWTTVLVITLYMCVWCIHGHIQQFIQHNFYFRKLQAIRSAPVCGATCGIHVFAGFVDKLFGHFRPAIRYGTLPRGWQNLYEMLPIYSSSIYYKDCDPPRRVPATIWRNLWQQNTHQHAAAIQVRALDTALWSVVEDMKTISLWWQMSTRWHMMSEKRLSILG